MIPKINARGTSFKGLAAYLLHDKDAATTERVAWVETVNLATRNPQTGWRVMAATAMNAAELKAQAGIKRTGRKSHDAVLHISLSWSPDQKPDRKHMTAFARRALEALKAEDRQAMMICHSDTDHSHLHLIVNRVSPKDGRMLSSSNEKLALSNLALAYEKEEGKIECPQRAANAELRAQGEYIRGEPDVPRAEYEPMREAQDEAEKSVPATLLQQHPQLIAKMRADFRQRWRDQARKAADQLKSKWQKLYDAQRSHAAELKVMRGQVLDQLAGTGASQPNRYTSAKDSLLTIATLKLKETRLFERERASLAKESRRVKIDAGRMLRSIYEAGLKQLALFRPLLVPTGGTAGPASIPQQNAPTEAQSRLRELARRFTQQSSGHKSELPVKTGRKRPEAIREKEWEPEP